jgi:hypothetical protein
LFGKPSFPHAGIRDADKGLEYFYEHCVQAGQLKCALYERTPKAVAARVAKIFDSFKRHPIPAVSGDGGPGDYGVIDYAHVRRLAFDFLYTPFQNGGQNFARILAALEKGDGSSFWAAQPIGANTQCDSNEKVEWNSNGFARLTTLAIQCGDGKQVKDTVPQLEKWYEANKNQSSFADQWPWALICAYVILRTRLGYDYVSSQTEVGRFERQKASRDHLGLRTPALLCSS